MQIRANGLTLGYDLQGPQGGSVITLSHPLGANRSVWQPQYQALTQRWQVLSYDARGHGDSAVGVPPISLQDLARDVIGLLDALGIEKTHFVGLSLGGMTGQALALHHPERLHSLTLCETVSEVPASAQLLWQERVRVATWQGIEPEVEPTLDRWLTRDFQRHHPDLVEQLRTMIRGTDKRGYAGCCQAMAQLALTEQLARLAVPTLVMACREDAETPASAHDMANRIPDCELAVLESGGQLPNLEQSQAFNDTLMRFVDRVEGSSRAEGRTG
jgi:3-oxoadipate enol-lactonase